MQVTNPTGKAKPTLVCDFCHARFTPRRSDQRFCSEEHRTAWWQKVREEGVRRLTGAAS